MLLNNQKGFTLIELLVTIAIIGVLAAVAVPQYTAYKTRAYDTNAQTNLRSIFTACKDYWTFNSSMSPCVLDTVSDKGFGFTPSDTVEITISSNEKNTEYDFYATASHTSSENVFAIDFRGVVSKTGGGGCSEQAEIDPKKLKKKGATGCGTSPDNKGKGKGPKK